MVILYPVFRVHERKIKDGKTLIFHLNNFYYVLNIFALFTIYE